MGVTHPPADTRVSPRGSPRPPPNTGVSPQVLRQFRLMTPLNGTCQGLGLEVAITGPIIYEGEAPPTRSPARVSPAPFLP